ncbi:hypothetical protein ACFQ3B_20030 [Stackebrandtia endophytica]|uniref:hypothetical protein n=1 Tax=Stackebrandtia endophytica TaxID=1496996 RepID=UPI001153E37B|nr:hypothetical protein [Stackebrandtia endophytica]
MNYSVPSPRSKSGVITAIQALLWIQVGLGFLQCPLAVFVGEFMRDGIFPSEVPPAPAENSAYVGAVIFAAALAVVVPQLVVIALRLTAGGRAMWAWALSALAAPLLLLAGFALTATLDASLGQIDALRAVGGMALYCVPVPVAAIACLLTPAARAWFHPDEPAAVEATVISWRD